MKAKTHFVFVTNPMIAFVLFFGFAFEEARGEVIVGTQQGEMYPDFMLPTVDGESARLSDYRGKKILLFHFASW